MGNRLDEVSRFAIYLGLMLSFGLPLFMVWASRKARLPHAVIRRTDILLPVTVGIATLASLSSLWAMAQSMSGSNTPALVWSTATVLLTKTTLGTAWIARITLLLLTLVVAVKRPFSFGLRAATVSGIAGIALSTLPWAGHGTVGSDGVGALHLLVDVTHLLVAGAWTGAIAGLVVIATADTPTAMTTDGLQLLSSAAVRFANVGTVLVAVLVLTGLANAIIVMGPHIPRFSTGGYAEVLLAKVTVFAAMLAMAGLNRYRLVPRVATVVGTSDTSRAVRALRRSLLIEALLAITVLALVSLLGTLDPAT
jgi:putative copper resistance protein D